MPICRHRDDGRGRCIDCGEFLDTWADTNPLRRHHVMSHQWLAETFEYEYCEECGGDACHHKAIQVAGNWFAQCQYSRNEDGTLHPVIAAYRKGAVPPGWKSVTT